MLKMKNTERFSDRVDNYVKYRPGYPEDLIDYFGKKGICKTSIVCDIGAGTGILSNLLIEKVKTLFVVEPNKEMLQYANKSLSQFENYHSIQSEAEDTKLTDSSIDAITIAQAFHWFDQKKCKIEFKRILKPNGLIFIIWNNRINNTPFLEEYDDLLHEYCTEYSKVNHQNITENILKNFIDDNFEKTLFNNYQEFNLEGFLGRVFSSSYTPSKNHNNYDIFLECLNNIFEKHNKDGIVRFNYKTEVYSGNMKK